MLEDLLAGIHGYWLIYDEYTADGTLVDDEDDVDVDESAEDAGEADTSAFLELVRAEAAKHPGRLT